MPQKPIPQKAVIQKPVEAGPVVNGTRYGSDQPRTFEQVNPLIPVTPTSPPSRAMFFPTVIKPMYGTNQPQTNKLPAWPSAKRTTLPGKVAPYTK